MPLIVMCGIPGSGKSSRSYEIAEYLKSKYKQKVIIVNEESLKVDKN
jgi:tRNA uridine 5-carbamoylmethylation protein Kti12